MIPCLFVTDLHGHIDRYLKLFDLIRREKPAAVFIGGDLLPHRLRAQRYENTVIDHFMTGFLIPKCIQLQKAMGKDYPSFFIIMGNDDARSEEPFFIQGDSKKCWHYLPGKKTDFRGYTLFGYSFVPPTPFQLKDWERYDVSRYVDPGCIHPTEGFRTIEMNEDIEHATIREDLAILARDEKLEKGIFLFHSPPYNTDLDRAALDGMFIDHVPVDVHVGSIAIQEFIMERKPYLTMHGHIHESSRLTGVWKQYLGTTVALNAAWDGPELSIVRFDLESPSDAIRILI